MLRLRLLCVGRRAKDPWLDAAELYLERLEHYAKVEVQRLRDGDADSERAALLSALAGDAPGATRVGLDERGRAVSTLDIASSLEGWERRSAPVTLFIGGASGLHADVLARATETWSLSRLTLPHRAALALLLEQLYRASTVRRGEPYHRA